MIPTTRYDRHMYALMNDRRAAAVHATTTRRRFAVTAHVALTAVGVGAWIGTVFGPGWGPALVVAGALLPWVLLTGVLNGSTRGLLELRGRMLDERQLAERDRVRALAHRITLWLLVAAAIGAGCLQHPGGCASARGRDTGPRRRARRALDDAAVGGGPACPGRADRLPGRRGLRR